MVMIPVTIDNLSALANDGRLGGVLQGVAADDALAYEFEVAPGEETEAAALQLADVLGLTLGPATVSSGITRRQVLVCEVQAAYLTRVTGSIVEAQAPLTMAQVLSFFTGECGAAVADAARGRAVDEAWDLPAVRAMLAEQPLEWHDVTELAHWLASLDELVQP